MLLDLSRLTLFHPLNDPVRQRRCLIHRGVRRKGAIVVIVRGLDQPIDLERIIVVVDRVDRTLNPRAHHQ